MLYHNLFTYICVGKGMYGHQRKALPTTLNLTQSHDPRNLGGLGERRELSPPNKHCSSFETLSQLAIQILNALNGI